jgi:hypothetical protein
MKILCIHGFAGTQKSFSSIIKHLKKHELIFFSYPERFGGVSLKTLASRASKIIEQEKPELLLCLSQGGIIGSLALEEYGMKKYCKKCITVCTPFAGSYLAYLYSTQGLKELRPGSELLRLLDSQIKKSSVKYYSAWNPLDLMVFPGKSADNKYAIASQRVISLFHPMTWHSKKTSEFILKNL